MIQMSIDFRFFLFMRTQTCLLFSIKKPGSMPKMAISEPKFAILKLKRPMSVKRNHEKMIKMNKSLNYSTSSHQNQARINKNKLIKEKFIDLSYIILNKLHIFPSNFFALRSKNQTKAKQKKIT